MSCCKCGGCGDQGSGTSPAGARLPVWPPSPIVWQHTARALPSTLCLPESLNPILVALQLPLQEAAQEPLVQPMDGAPAYPVSHAAVHVLPLAVALQPPTGRLALAGGAGSDVQ